ncbi:hypothetical protein GCM10028796_23890 [Ramlibacter monticola]|uniref:Aromatic-ring-hydroxylating dioxygenase subunit beta n=1 Tax=Ramlibacter monticola TaxID=1926872 RepID=A0A936Z0D6_9BURK|nr:aromatic-ring-hydroxylating dioxygenase subunit beta [Ramlibacter monticola]MBL0392634.1 aromatic-ring-hydroxylating dioxygenase subunit beta [Ramlibacter monticola]
MNESRAIPDAGPDFEHLVAQEAANSGAAGARTLPTLPRPGLSAGLDLQREVEQFLYRQAELLDGKHWQAWIDLFDAAGVYWMPITPEQSDWEGSPSIFAEDRQMMEIRRGRVTHPNAWSQAPQWATSHLVSHVVIEAGDGQQLQVRSRFHMMELRRDQVRHFGGSYRHTLVRDDAGQLRIRLQRVDLFNSQAPYDYVLQVWV